MAIRSSRFEDALSWTVLSFLSNCAASNGRSKSKTFGGAFAHALGTGGSGQLFFLFIQTHQLLNGADIQQGKTSLWADAIVADQVSEQIPVLLESESRTAWMLSALIA